MIIDKIILFLNGDRGIFILNHLLQEGRNIVAIVAPEDSFFWKIANQYCKQQLIRSAKVNDDKTVRLLRSLNPDMFIVAGFPTIFKKMLLTIPKFGTLNLHGGPVPQYRGGSPLNWQIINGEKKIGVSIILMDNGIDTGDILAQGFFDLALTDDINTVHQKANKCFVKLVSEVIKRFEKNEIFPQKQNEHAAQYWVQRSPQDGFIQWSVMTAQQVVNLIRALKPPYPSAFTYLDSQKIFLYDAVVPGKTIKGVPGKVIYLQKIGPYVICCDKAVLILGSSSGMKNGIHLTSTQSKILEEA